MRQRSPVVTSNLIRLRRSLHKGCFLVVEGRDDRLFCEQFVDTDSCAVIVAQGKQNVVEVIDTLEVSRFPGVVGLVDADFDRIEGCEWESDNLILLEPVDLEAMLIRSSALDRVLVEFGTPGKLAVFGKNIREMLVEAAIPIGCLRLHSKRAGLDLRFRNLRYASFIDRRSLRNNIHALIRDVKNRSQRTGLPCENLVQEINAIAGSLEDPWLVCSGDDLVSILALGLKTALGTNHSHKVAYDVICRCLRLAYQRDEFDNSKLFGDLRRWTIRNPGYRVLQQG